MANERTIVLQGDLVKRADEKYITTGQTVKPGHLLMRDSDDKVKPHNSRGGRNQRLFAKEDAHQGKTINDAYGADALCFFHIAQPNDKIKAILHDGENVAIGDWLVSYGDGTLCKAATEFLTNSVAASTTVTNTNTETTFSTGTTTIPKNTLKVGDIIRIHGIVTFPSTNSTDTALIKVYSGTDALLTSGAVDVANADVCEFDLTLTIRTIGATGTMVGSGWFNIGAPGTATTRAVSVASTTIDTTADITLTVKVTWSVASTSNQAILQQNIVEHVQAHSDAGPQGDLIGTVVDAAVNLTSAGADGWVNCQVA